MAIYFIMYFLAGLLTTTFMSSIAGFKETDSQSKIIVTIAAEIFFWPFVWLAILVIFCRPYPRIK